MQMIWHNDKFIQFRIRKMFGNGTPKRIGDFTPFIQMHCAVYCFAE